MKFLPAKPSSRAVETVDAGQLPQVPQPVQFNPFFSFSYSSHEMHVSGGQTHVKSKQVRFEDGRLKSEEFEARMPVAVFDSALGNAQRMMMDHTMSMLKQFSFWLPAPAKPDDKD